MHAVARQYLTNGLTDTAPCPRHQGVAAGQRKRLARIRRICHTKPSKIVIKDVENTGVNSL
jgi:hypothetical protein